jgi:hypothetical protein
MDGEEHRPPTPHRSGRARAPQALASALARAEVDGSVLVWCSPLPWLRPVLLTPLCVSGGASWFLHPSAPDEPGTGVGAGCGPDRRCRFSSARCPLPLDPPWSPGGVDQQVLQELPAAQQQVGEGRCGDPGFGDKVFRSYARTYNNGEVYHYLRDKSFLNKVTASWRELHARGLKLMRLGVEAAEVPGRLGVSAERWREILEACSQRVVALEVGED